MSDIVEKMLQDAQTIAALRAERGELLSMLDSVRKGREIADTQLADARRENYQLQQEFGLIEKFIQNGNILHTRKARSVECADSCVACLLMRIVRRAALAGDSPHVAVAGDMLLTSIAVFQRKCEVHLAAEQAKPSPDNALVDTLCEAVRMSREYVGYVKGDLESRLNALAKEGEAPK